MVPLLVTRSAARQPGSGLGSKINNGFVKPSQTQDSNVSADESDLIDFFQLVILNLRLVSGHRGDL